MSPYHILVIKIVLHGSCRCRILRTDVVQVYQAYSSLHNVQYDPSSRSFCAPSPMSIPKKVPSGSILPIRIFIMLCIFCCIHGDYWYTEINPSRFPSRRWFTFEFYCTWMGFGGRSDTACWSNVWLKNCQKKMWLGRGRPALSATTRITSLV